MTKTSAAAPPDAVDDDNQPTPTEAPTRIPAFVSSRRRLGAMLLVVVIVVGAVLFWQSRQQEDEPLPEGTAARVGNTPVSVADLDQRIAVLQAVYGLQPSTDTDELDRFRRQAAKSFVISLVVSNEAAEREIVVPEATADAELDRLIRRQLDGDVDAFNDYLATSGISRQDVTDEVVRTLELNQLYEQVTADVPKVSLADARAEFDANRSDYDTPVRRAISNIVVATKRDAFAALDELMAERGFAGVVQRYSVDAATRRTGGRIGLLSTDELEPRFGRAAFASEIGVPFGPVRSSHGWNVGVVTEETPARRARFAEVSERIVDDLTLRARAEAWQEWLGSALADADLEYADDYRPENPSGAAFEPTLD